MGRAHPSTDTAIGATADARALKSGRGALLRMRSDGRSEILRIVQEDDRSRRLLGVLPLNFGTLTFWFLSMWMHVLGRAYVMVFMVFWHFGDLSLVHHRDCGHPLSYAIPLGWHTRCFFL
jgi:hypothetical protein